MPRTQGIFAWRELTTRKLRSTLTWFGMVVGLLGFGTSLTALLYLSNDLSTNFLQTNPPHFIATAPSISPLHLEEVRSQPEMAEFEFRGLISGKIQVADERWMSLQVFVVEDFEQMRVAKIYPQETSWPPPIGSMVLERSGRPFFREAAGFDGSTRQVQPGTQWPVRMAGQGLEIPIHGFAFDPAMAPSPMERIIYGYVSTETFQNWNLGFKQDRLLGTLSKKNATTSDVWEAVNKLRAAFQAKELTQLEMWVPEAGEHPHQFQMTAMLVIIAGLALLAFLLCAILVVNLTGAILMNKLRQIAILRAIGGGKRQVMVMLLGPMLLLGVFTSLTAVPLSLLWGRRLALGIAQLLNFELLTPALPLWVMLVLALLGIFLPVGVAFLPISRTVRAHLGPVFREDFQLKAVVRGEGNLPGWLPASWTMMIRNAFRRRGRTVWTVLTLATGLAFYMAALNVRASLMRTIDTVEGSLKHDLRVSLAHEISETPENDPLGSSPVVEFAEYWHRGRVYLLNELGYPGNPQTLYMVPPNQKAIVPNLLQGSWLSVDKPLGVVVNQKFLMDHPHWQLGERYPMLVRSRKVEVKLVGVIKEFNLGTVYVLQDSLAAFDFPPIPANVALLKLYSRDFGAHRKYSRELEMLEQEGKRLVHGVELTGILVLIVRRHLDVIAIVLGVVALIMLAVGGMGMASGISVTVAERAREVGVMRAMGASRLLVLWVLIGEALVMACLAWVLALAVADPLSRGISEYFGTLIVEYPFDFTYAKWSLLSSAGVAGVMAGLSSLLAAVPALKRPVGDALRCV